MQVRIFCLLIILFNISACAGKSEHFDLNNEAYKIQDGLYIAKPKSNAVADTCYFLDVKKGKIHLEYYCIPKGRLVRNKITDELKYTGNPKTPYKGASFKIIRKNDGFYIFGEKITKNKNFSAKKCYKFCYLIPDFNTINIELKRRGCRNAYYFFEKLFGVSEEEQSPSLGPLLRSVSLLTPEKKYKMEMDQIVEKYLKERQTLKDMKQRE